MKYIYEDKNFKYSFPLRINLKYFIKLIVYFLISLKYSFLIKLLLPKCKIQKKYKVSLCAIFRDEGDILKEWIEYHKIVGVEHFYLYNNWSKDNYKQILAPYIKEGLVTLIDWPYERKQMEAYKNCADNYKDESQWIGFIDLDEFVVPNGRMETIYDFLKDFDRKAPFVVIYWRYFGSSGLIERDKTQLVTETFKCCWYKFEDMGKYFWNTNFNYDTRKKQQTGYMHSRWGNIKFLDIPSMNEFGKFLLFGFHKGAKTEFPIQINHYVIKSFNEYCEKKAKRGGGIHAQEGFHNMTYFFDHDRYCQCMDYKIMRYMIKLKLAMKK